MRRPWALPSWIDLENEPEVEFSAELSDRKSPIFCHFHTDFESFFIKNSLLEREYSNITIPYTLTHA